MQEIKGDLFRNDQGNLVHCVSRDLAMGAGIAIQFKRRFGRVDELRAQKAKVGEMAVLTVGHRHIFYLVTKEKYWGKPTYDTLRSSLLKLKEYCLAYQVTSLSMPRIGCGLDRLSWPKVKEVIAEILEGIQVKIYFL
jgi:O-acetyl-ADP-ribose deacetylase (regulator of RNase III)